MTRIATLGLHEDREGDVEYIAEKDGDMYLLNPSDDEFRVMGRILSTGEVKSELGGLKQYADVELSGSPDYVSEDEVDLIQASIYARTRDYDDSTI
mgnify:CR=1 FL=1